ncbi:YceI family protein [Saccharopolyspora shandongensis]|uniref:YceI family protein n=1 Tax=Saccharopolyspora shandongensis TaxID=418495 RepID=UPI0033F4CB8C
MTTETTALPLKAGRWALDPLHSSVGFAIRHLGVSKVRGRFAEVDAELVVGGTLDGSAINATVAVASIDTGNPDRDAHVLAPDLLDVAKRPTLAFRSTRLSGAGEDWTLEGELTIGEVTRPIAFDVEFGGVQDLPDGSRHAGFEANGEIRRRDYGINFGPGEALLGDVVKIQLDVQFVEPK